MIVPTVAAEMPSTKVFWSASWVWLNSKKTNLQCSSDKPAKSGPAQFFTNAVRSNTPYGRKMEQPRTKAKRAKAAIFQ